LGILASAGGRREVAAVQTIKNKNKKNKKIPGSQLRRRKRTGLSQSPAGRRDAEADWGYQRMR
jgi:hypothetical protein